MACRDLCVRFSKEINNRELYKNGNVYCRQCECRFNMDEAKAIMGERPGFNNTTMKNEDGTKKAVEKSNCPCCHSRVRTTGTDRYQVALQKYGSDARPRIEGELEELTERVAELEVRLPC